MGEEHDEPTETQQPHTPDATKKTEARTERSSGPRTQSIGMDAIEAARRTTDPKNHRLSPDPGR
jgi:hypothetical protein